MIQSDKVKVSSTSKTCDKSDLFQPLGCCYSKNRDQPNNNPRDLKRHRQMVKPIRPPESHRDEIRMEGESLLNRYEKEGEKEEKVGCQTPR